MMRLKNLLPLTCILLTVGIFIYLFISRPKLVYMNNANVYNSFTLKKELEAKLNIQKLSRDNVLDSMRAELKMISENPQGISAREFDLMKDKFLFKKEQFEEETTTLENAYTLQVWTQLNQYVKDYGEKNGYDIIMGTTSDGSLMYAKESIDITDKLTEYINSRYEGK